jgi:outer membrane lipoprotein-sorting protein
MIRLVSVLGLATLIVSATQPSHGDAFERLFAKASAKRDTIRSIRAHFTETTESSLLQAPVVAHGTVVAVPAARVLMTYTDPERRYVLVDATALVVVWPDRNERERIDIAQMQKRIDKYFTHATIDDLRGMFDVTVAADQGIANTDRVLMQPRRKPIKEGLERLDLWIDRESQLLVQMEMRFPGGDRKRIRLDDMAINVPVTDATFAIPR